MPAPRRNSIRRDEPVSLRRGEASNLFSDEQLLVLSVFSASVLQAGHGVYLKLSSDGSSLRVKIYTDDDSYQDNISVREDIAYLLADYAKQLKCSPIFEGLMAALHGATSQAASGAAPAGSVGAKPLKRPPQASD